MNPVMPDYVQAARSDAGKLGKVAADYAASSFTIPDELKKVVQEALDYNKDVIGMRSQAFNDWSKSPADANVKFGVDKFTAGPQAGQANPDFIFNPFERNKAISDYVSNSQVPFMTANTLLGLREGSTSDIINAGTRSFQAQSAAAEAAANAAQKTYEDALTEFKTLEDIKYKNKALAQDRELELMRINKSGTDNSLSGLNAILGTLLPKNMGAPKEAMPQSTPRNGATSRGGEWIGQNGKWVPSGKSSYEAQSGLKDFFTQDNVVAMMAADPKHASTYSSLYKMFNPTQGKVTEQVKQNAISGLNALGKARSELARDSGVIAKSQLPDALAGILGGGSYKAAVKEVADVYTRLRTGAALNKEEQEFYDSQLPKVTDQPRDIEYKLSLFEDLFSRLSGQQNAVDELDQLLFGF